MAFWWGRWDEGRELPWSRNSRCKEAEVGNRTTAKAAGEFVRMAVKRGPSGGDEVRAGGKGQVVKELEGQAQSQTSPYRK